LLLILCPMYSCVLTASTIKRISINQSNEILERNSSVAVYTDSSNMQDVPEASVKAVSTRPARSHKTATMSTVASLPRLRIGSAHELNDSQPPSASCNLLAAAVCLSGRHAPAVAPTSPGAATTHKSRRPCRRRRRRDRAIRPANPSPRRAVRLRH